MGRDNQAKDRQLRRSSFKRAHRASYARILIVTEGSKTEPLYLEEIRATYQLHSANVEVQPGRLGTAPIQVVRYAQQLFEDGDLRRGIRPRSFDQVYVVFDRDDHKSYFDALNLADSLDGKLHNDERQQVRFKSIASIPCFELWLLLHFEEIRAPIHRNEVMDRLQIHVPDYEKGKGDVFSITRNRLPDATERAASLARQANAYTDPAPYTALHDLVALLCALRT